MTTFRRFFSLASATAFAVALLAAPASRAAEPLLLQWGAIDTDAPAAQAESAALKAKVARKAAAVRKAGAAAEARAAYLVQFPAAVSEAQRTWLEASTQVRGYIPENAYIVWATPSEMDAIAASPDVSWTGEWKKEYKTVRAAAAKRADASEEARWMQVGSLLAGDEGAADLRARLEALPATVRSAFPRLDGVSAVAFLTDAQIDEVASWADVDWIEPKLKPILLNDKAALTNMMNVTPAWKAIASGGLGLTGAGQVVAVADTGCDKGSTSDIHADFSGRIKAGYGWTNGAYKSSASWADVDAHGTHVCGSVLGSGAQSSGQFRGIAYEAQLVMQGCWEDLGGLPDNAQDLFKQAYSQGARIHSDSWGFDTNLAAQYVYDAVYADGYMWTNQNFLALFAAGNDGIDKNKDGVIDPGSVTPPSTSKNCLSVGAAENYRSSGGYSTTTWGGAWGSDYPTAPIKGDKISGTTTPQGLAAFSSRGPTQDGRFKPDIVAPGTDIISVRSRPAQDDGWGVYSSNTNYLYEGGTSMATPLTSGATTLVRQWLVDRQGIAEPMAALMKALLINGARDMTPGQYGTGSTQEITARPDRSQGFGHVNLYNALEPGDGNFLVFATNKFTTTGANYTTNIAVGQANAGKYILTLAWQDYPGTSGASKTLVNDLDLTVTSPSGTVYYPNNLATNDHLNNIEFIEFTATEVGSYAVKVNANKISKTTGVGSQPFALVMRGPETVLEPAAPEFSAATSATNGVQHGEIEFTFSDLLSAGYPAPTYSITTAVSSDEYDFDGNTGYLYFQPADAGTFTFTCVASNENGTATNTLTVTVTPAPPETPSEVTVVGSDSFTAIWSAVSGASGYELVVFEGSASGGGGSGPFTLVTSSSGLTAGEYVILADGIDRAMNNSFTTSYLSYEDVTVDNSTISTDDASIIWTLAGNAAACTLFNADAEKFVNPATSKTVGWSSDASGSWTLSLNNGLVTVANAADSTWMLQYNSGSPRFTCYNSAQKKLRFFRRDAGRSLPRAVGDVVYSNSVGNVTNFVVTGLQPETSYTYAVRAIVNGQPTAWSDSVPVTTAAGDSAPSISVEQTSYAVTVGAPDVDFTVTVTGSPAPTVTHSCTEGAFYVFEDGEFLFTPDTVGTYHFVFTATNSEGTDSVTVTVTVSAAAVTVPTLLVDDATDTTAYAIWDECAGVSSYTLQLASDNQFTTGGSGAAVLEADFSDTSDWTLSGTGTYTGSAYYGQGSPSIKFDGTGDYAISPEFGGGSKLSFWAYGNGSGTASTFAISGLVNGSWSAIETVDIATGADTYEVNLPSGTTQLRFDFTKNGYNCALDDVVVTGASGSGSLIAEYTVADTEYTFTGLSPFTVYYARVKGNADWSNIAEFITDVAGDSAPVWSTLPTPSVTVGSAYSFTPAEYVSGTPAPTITLSSTTASSGYTFANGTLSFTPAATGSFDFTFTANNGIGSPASATLTVASTGTAPAVSVPQTSYSTSLGGDNVEFTVTATGTPTPTLALSDTTATSGVTFDENDGSFSFTPYATGSFTFTFTATSLLGSDSKTVTVTVSPAPVTVPTLSVTEVTDTTAFASWTACDGVSTYTLQLTDEDFPPASSSSARSLTTLLEETFAKATGTATITSFDSKADNPGWEGSYVLAHNGAVRLSSGSGSGELLSPWLTNATAGASVRVVFSSLTWTNDYTSAVIDITEDGENFTDSNSFELGASMQAYTNTFTVTGTRFRIRWTPSANKKRFFLDDITITTPSSGGGDDPGGDSIQEFTVTGTSHTFTNLTPQTYYLSRVKGNADWSEEILFMTTGSAGTAPSWSALPGNATVVAGGTYELDLSPYVSGDAPITITIADSELEAEMVDSTFIFYPVATGTPTFTFTASNNYGTAEATLTVTVTGTAPAWSPIPVQSVTVGDDFELDLSTYVSGNPAPVLDVDENAHNGIVVDSTFACTPASAGTLTFTIVATNVLGTAETTLTLNATAAGTAPVWSAIPAQTVTVGQDCNLDLSPYVSGTAPITISLVPTEYDAVLVGTEFSFTPDAPGTFTFTFTAANGIGSADATLTVTATGTAPVVTVTPATYSYDATVGDPYVEFTVTASGNPAPTLTATCTEGAYFVFENNAFLFDPDTAGTYHFVFTAANGVSPDDTKTVTVTVSEADVPIPELAISGVTSTNAIATWTACIGATGYRLQLATDTNFTAGGFATLLSENFVGVTNSSQTEIKSIDSVMQTGGWFATNAYPHSGVLRLGKGSGAGVLQTPAIAASSTLRVVWSGCQWTNDAPVTVCVGISENGTDFTETNVTLTASMDSYTNTFELAGTASVMVRWRSSKTSNQRFFIDNIVISGGSPAGGGSGSFVFDSVVSGLTHTFTGLTPDTVYYARVKDEDAADWAWSNVEEFLTDEGPVTGTAPSWDTIPAQSWTMGSDFFTLDLSQYVHGDAPITLILATTTWVADIIDDTFAFEPDDAGDYTFTVTASNTYGTADATFTVTVTESSSPAESLEIVFPDLSASATSFNVEGATTDHSYEFLWTTNLLVPGFTTNTYTATNTTFSVPFPATGTWFGYVRPASP